MQTIKRDTEIVWSSYGASFVYFFKEYKELCLSVSTEKDIFKANKKISSFFSDFMYAVPDEEKRVYFSKTIRKFYLEVKDDVSISKILSLGTRDLKTDIAYYKIYYPYYFKHLNLLGEFIEELTPSFMPNTNLQRKMIRYFNDEYFFVSFMEFKKVMVDRLVRFKLDTFFETFNTLLTFFYAYNLFINSRVKGMVDDTLSLIYSLMMNQETLRVLKNYPNIGRSDKEFLINIENKIYDMFHFCNEQINISFSNYGVLPKINRKINIDTTLM